MIKVTDVKLIEVSVPAEFFALQVPHGVSLDKWYKAETKRLARMYPNPKIEAAEVDPAYADILTAISTFDAWAKKKKLLKLALREQMEWAEYATVNGHRIAKRQQHHVREYAVNGYDLDTIVAVLHAQDTLHLRILRPHQVDPCTRTARAAGYR